MNSQIREDKARGEVHVVIVCALPDTAKGLEEVLEQKGYKVSIAADSEAQPSPLASDAILKVTSEENVDCPVPRQQRTSVSEIMEAEASHPASAATLAREKLHGDYSEIIGKSPQIFNVLQQIENLADTPMRVLISGETGTGKEGVARALHENSSRSQKEMVCVNCAAIPENLIADELFGHEKGAFTSADRRHIGKFERAHNGTLFLDEIGEMPLAMQPTLLRAIETGEIEHIGGEKSIAVDVRIVTATNRDLAQAVQEGRFRQDLYYRLNMVSISLPTLAERQEDIDELVVHFLEKHRKTCEPRILQVSPSTLALLKSYRWPGNVRELENAIERASYLAKGEILLPEHLPEEIRMYQQRPVNVHEKLPTPENEQKVNVLLGMTLEAVEETFICKTLAELGGNRTKTAKQLEIGIRTLQRKLKKYGV